MERWAANTLRTVGIILTAGFVLIVSLILALESFCAANGGIGGNKHPNQVVPYALAAVAVVILGLFIIAKLARGIASAVPAVGPPIPGAPGSASYPADTALPPATPLHLSPASRKAIDRLVLALIAQIAISAIAWFFNQFYFWSAARPHNWTLILLAPFVLYHVPYAILIYFLLKNPDRRTFTYAIAVPSVLILQSLLSLSLVTYTYIHRPAGFFLILLPWLLNSAILVLAYKAIQQVGIHPEPSGLFVAAAVTFTYCFLFIHALTPFLYRLAWK